jgi:hypothetical protein
MKIFIRIIILILALIPTFSLGNDLINFSIEKSIYENLSQNQQQAITIKVSEYNTFFYDEVIPKIPALILEKVKDLQVTIHFTDKAGRDGIFIPGSDQHKHKINVQLIQINSNGLKSLLAHEFFHALQYEINPDEMPWVREGLAQLFEYIVTEEMNGQNLQAAILNPLTPLIGEYNIDNSSPAQYGHNMLYFFYLYKHCGENQIFWELAEGTDELRGAYLIDTVLKGNNSNSPECKSFLSSVKSFEVAKLHNQIQFSPEYSERFFLAPTNLSPTELHINTSAELVSAVQSMPLYSSLKIKLESWNNLKGQCKDCSLFYANRSFPYTVSEEMPIKITSNYDVILVLTEVSSKNARK